MTEEDAREKAHEKIPWLIKRVFFEYYTAFIRRTLLVTENEVHQEMLSDIEDKTGEGVAVDKAIKKVLGQHRAKFDSLFEYEESDEEEMEVAEESSEDSDEQ